MQQFWLVAGAHTCVRFWQKLAFHCYRRTAHSNAPLVTHRHLEEIILVPYEMHSMQRPLVTYFIYYLCHFLAVHELRTLHNNCGLLKAFSKICHCSSKNALDNGGQEKGAVCLMYPVIHLSQICCHNSIPRSISICNQRPLLKGLIFLSTQRSISLTFPLYASLSRVQAHPR